VQVSTEGIVIKEKSAGDDDRLVVALTRARGLITAYANGARRVKSRQASATQQFCYASLALYRARDTYRIDEISAIEVFFGLRKDLTKLSLAQYFCELALALAPEEEEAGAFVDLLLAAFQLLEHDKRPAALIKAVTELRLLALSGYQPDVIACESCGRGESDCMWLDAKNGRMRCDTCRRPGERGTLPLPRGALAAMRHILYAKPEKLFAFALPEPALGRLAAACEALLLAQTDRRYPTLEFYKTLAEENHEVEL